MNNYRQNLISEFKNYTNAYDISDPKIKLKVDHTYRVAALCEEIAKSLNLNTEDTEIIWTSGMLHDIGRFEQVKRYGTFADGQSVDHAQFGADLLFKEGLYEKFVNDSDLRKKDLVEKTIRAHNKFILPDTLSESEIVFANILRDADKIDILRANCDTPTEDVYNVTTSELKNAAVSEDVKEAFKQHRCAKRHPGMTPVDHLTGHICFTFELVYPRSLQLMFEQGYLFKLLDFKSDNKDTQNWFTFMQSEMKAMADQVSR